MPTTTTARLGADSRPAPVCPSWCTDRQHHGIEAEQPLNSWYSHTFPVASAPDRYFVQVAALQLFTGEDDPAGVVVSATDGALTAAEARALAVALAAAADLVEADGAMAVTPFFADAVAQRLSIGWTVSDALAGELLAEQARQGVTLREWAGRAGLPVELVTRELLTPPRQETPDGELEFCGLTIDVAIRLGDALGVPVWTLLQAAQATQPADVATGPATDQRGVEVATSAASQLPEAVRAAMETAGLSRVEVARESGIPLVTLHRRLSGRGRAFSVVELAAVGEVLGVSVVELGAAAERLHSTV